MFVALAKKIFGTSNDRYIKKLRRVVADINAKEPAIHSLNDDELRAKTLEFKEKLKNGYTLDDILVEAFAVAREAGLRVLGERAYDVQLIGAMVLNNNKIAEMKTGEGKTLVAAIAGYLNALSGKGVHIITVNDYLAKRDSEWVGRIPAFLGLTVGCITSDLPDYQRKEAYAADITYGTNSQFGFDYLRDNMKDSLENMVQRPFNYAIVDEVDSILIDEARTPLIISGQTEDSTDRYAAIDKLIPMLSDEDYEKDEKQKTVVLTDSGNIKIEQLMKDAGLITTGGLYDIQNLNYVHHISQALRAHKLFQKEVDYIVKDGKIVIIDEFTGRLMEDRRYGDGLHQALEAKEHVKIQSENQTLASVTYQNYFRMYPKLAGMTGTAMTEASEFADIYKLDVIDIPTNVPCVRIDHEDEIYRTADEKYTAIINTIVACHDKGQPVLVGTVSVEKSEILADLLKKKTKIKFEVLNAKNHAREAAIIAQAGTFGAVTIATNMAGRGTDIKLGGNLEMRVKNELADITDEKAREEKTALIKKEIEENKRKVIEAGGLYIIGTERHESRRIDNQLRGRSGRQGDKGESKFFLSMEDDLMRIFGSDRIAKYLKTLGLEDGEPISHSWVTSAIRNAQSKVEAHNYDIRKNLLKYDDVMNDQRKMVYAQRCELMTAKDAKDIVAEMRHDMAADMVYSYCSDKSLPQDWDLQSMKMETIRLLNLDVPYDEIVKNEHLTVDALADKLCDISDALIKEKEEKYGEEVVRIIEKNIMLDSIDRCWREHLHALDYVRSTIFLRAYGQKDPLNEYKKEAFNLFKMLGDKIRERTVFMISHAEIRFNDRDPGEMVERQRTHGMREVKEDAESVFDRGRDDETAAREPFRYNKNQAINPNDPSTWGKVSRNELCPCGSGKKYKHCHGAINN